MIAMDDWEDVMRPQVVKAMARLGSCCVVACHPDSPSDLYGFAVAESDVHVPKSERSKGAWQRRMAPAGMPMLVFLYTKQAYRGLGIGRGLMHAAGVDPEKPFLYACKTPAVSKCPLFAHGRFSPLTVRYPKE